jgi:site-specific recombinase XerD
MKIKKDKDILMYIRRLEDEIIFQNLSKTTKGGYVHVVKKMLIALMTEGKEVNEETIASYVRSELGANSNLAVATRKQYFYALRFFVRRALKMSDTTIIIPRLKDKKRVPLIFTKDQIASIFSRAKNLKEYAILSTLYLTGIRINELIHIKIGDIFSDRSPALILISQGKGNKERFVPFTQELREILIAWWQREHPKTEKNPKESYLFCKKDGSQLTTAEVRLIWEQCLKKEGYGKVNIGIHTLRRCFATHSLEAGINMFTLSKWMGHSNIISTARYLQQTDILQRNQMDILAIQIAEPLQKAFTVFTL